MPSFLETSQQLDSALKDAEAKKSALENASKALKEAGDAYQAAAYKAQQLRGDLNSILDNTLPTSEIKPKIG